MTKKSVEIRWRCLTNEVFRIFKPIFPLKAVENCFQPIVILKDLLKIFRLSYLLGGYGVLYGRPWLVVQAPRRQCGRRGEEAVW